MTDDLRDRLAEYREPLDRSIERYRSSVVRPPRRVERTSLLAVAAATVLAFGLVGLAWRASTAPTESSNAGTPSPTTQATTESIAPSAPTSIDGPTTSPTAPPTESDPTPPPGRRLAIGDSVMLGAAEELIALGFGVDAEPSRMPTEAVDVLRGLAVPVGTGDTVVVHVGNNGTFSAADVEQLVLATADVERLVLVTIAIDRVYAGPNNERLVAAAAANDHVELLDWAGLTGACPESCFWDDQIHLRPDGAAFYAGLLDDAAPAPSAGVRTEPSALCVAPGATAPFELVNDGGSPVLFTFLNAWVIDESGASMSAASLDADRPVTRDAVEFSTDTTIAPIAPTELGPGGRVAMAVRAPASTGDHLVQIASTPPVRVPLVVSDDCPATS